MFSAPRHSIPLFPTFLLTVDELVMYAEFRRNQIHTNSHKKLWKAISICNILLMMMIAADADADDGADDDHDLKLALPPLCRCG